jgi:hypothetical protein
MEKRLVGLAVKYLVAVVYPIKKIGLTSVRLIVFSLQIVWLFYSVTETTFH